MQDAFLEEIGRKQALCTNMGNQIQGMVNPRAITFTPIDQGVQIGVTIANDSIITFPNLIYTTTPFSTSIKIHVNDWYIIGKVENENVLKLPPMVVFAKYAPFFTTPSGTYKGAFNIAYYYDSTNTYLLINDNIILGTDIAGTFLPTTPILYNSQSIV